MSRVAGLVLTLCLLPVVGTSCGNRGKVALDAGAELSDVDRYRMRITKVRHAIDETRAVLAEADGASHQPEVYLRLAELTSEEARYHYAVARERQGGDVAPHAPQVEALKDQAIAIYRSILRSWPQTHLADDVLFAISQEQRELGRVDSMLGTLSVLVTDHPESPLVPEAMLILGDHHFDAAELVPARDYYTRVLEHPFGAELAPLAWYKLAWVELNEADCSATLEALRQAILTEPEQARAASSEERAPAAFQLPDATMITVAEQRSSSFDVRREALVDMAYCYAQEHPAELAAETLRELAPDRGAYVAALRAMARRYAVLEQDAGQLPVLRELMRLAPDSPDTLDDARMLYGAVSRTEDFSVVGDDVAAILVAWRRQALRPDMDTASLAALHEEFEALARDLATRADTAARAGTSGPGEPIAPALGHQVSQAYRVWLDTFPASPERAALTLNRADLLAELDQHLEAGHAYREVAQLLVEAEQPGARGDALLNAVASYQATLVGDEPRTAWERSAARAGLRDAGASWLAEPGGADADRRKVRFALARSLQESGETEHAVFLLTALALEHPGSEEGDAAARLVLDVHRTRDDTDRLLADSRRFASDHYGLASDVQHVAGQVVTMAEQRRLDELSMAAAGDLPGGLEALLAYADEHRDGELGQKALASTMLAAQATGDAELLYRVGAEILERYPSYDQRLGVITMLGQTAATRLEFDRAISWMEQAGARIGDGDGDATALLLGAAELKRALGDTRGAFSDYRVVAQAPEPRGSAEAWRRLADVGSIGLEPQELVALLQLRADGDPDLTSQLGVALLRAGRPYEAETHFHAVVQRPDAGPTALARSWFGLGEVSLALFEDMGPVSDLDGVEETLAMVDVISQAYVAAARQADMRWSQHALARLSWATARGAERLAGFVPPPELSPADRSLLSEAMQQRVATLESASQDALHRCAARAESAWLVDEASLACLRGEAPAALALEEPALRPRLARAELDGSEVTAARAQLSRDADDRDALRELGLAYLDAGDPHAARLAFHRATSDGALAADLNALGVASWRAGDVAGAATSFGRGREAGSVAAAHNLAEIYRRLGLVELVERTLEGVSSQPDGPLIGTAAGEG